MGGFPLVKWWALRIAMTDRRLNPLDKTVYAALLFYHNTKTGRCDPSAARLGYDLDRSDRTIRSGITQLGEAGYVVRHKGSGWRGTNQHDLWMPAGKAEFQKLEDSRRNAWKNSAAEQMNEHMKDEAASARQKKPARDREDSANDPHSGRRRIQRLENEFVRSIGDQEVAYELLMAIEQEEREAIEGRYARSEITLKAALQLYADAISKIQG